MQLDGSCHCGAVRFSVISANPYPYQRCYCSICRKTQGGGGYAINLAGDAASMEITGGDKVTVYHAKMRDEDSEDEYNSSSERHFCSLCGSALWLFSPGWPELIHPFASAIDTNLPIPPQHTHLLLGSKASWVEIEAHEGDNMFADFPEESIAQWHERQNLTSD